MNQEITRAEQDVEEGGRGLAKLNPSPTRAHALVVKIEGAPGPLDVVEAVAQYDVTNEAQCGRVIPATGTAGRITSQEPVTLRRVGDNEYHGTVYLDRMLDEDYYGRGVCQWAFSGASAMLKASGAPGETRFLSFIDAETLTNDQPTVRYYTKRTYPRARMEDFPDNGEASPSDYTPELQKETFSVTLSGKGDAR